MLFKFFHLKYKNAHQACRKGGESFTNFSKDPMQPGDHRGKYLMAQ